MLNPFTLIVFTQIASTVGFLIACIFIIVVLFIRKHTTLALIYFFTTIGLMLSTTVLKLLCKIPRPDNPLITITGYGFPSGHATGAIFLGLTLSYLSSDLPKPLRYVVFGVLATLVLVIGLSRIYYNVHTPLQVIAGFILGSLWAGVFIYFSKHK